jgi:hypothetical protein
MIVYALAGRRPDRTDAEAQRFPIGNRSLVGERVESLFAVRQADALVASAACGADLIALDVAGRLGMRRHVVLPFGRVKFRETSVTDRPGDWGADYDRVIAAVETAGGLTELGMTQDGDEPYLRTNEAIIEQAGALAGDGGTARICLVWEGKPRGANDITFQLADTARARGWPVDEVLTV